MHETESISYEDLASTAVTDRHLADCAELFSQHYGVWSSEAPVPLKPGSRVRTTIKRLREEQMFDERCRLVRARTDAGQLVGHCFVHRYEVPSKGTVSWITQLVVHTDFRRLGIASKLCRMAWAVDSFHAAGLVSSHPYAVRALERATERQCDRSLIALEASDILHHTRVPYVRGRQLRCDGGCCLIDTAIYVDHTELDSILAACPGWCLGPLEEGKEFFAFVFAACHRSLQTAQQRAS